jgi:RNA polymerase sigma-70 factor (ECF subfamily)
LTDAELVHRARASDADAWRTLYDRYLPMVWRRAYALVGDVHAAEDVTSETMLALLKNLSRLEGLEGESASVAGWLASVVRRQAAEHHRQVFRAREKLAAVAVAPDSATEREPAALEVEETRLEVLRVLDEMPERQRLALEWKYLESLGVREIAERLGESERAVEAVLYRARRGFRQAFDPKRMAK